MPLRTVGVVWSLNNSEDKWQKGLLLALIDNTRSHVAMS